MSETSVSTSPDPGLVARLASKARGLSEQLKAVITDRDAHKARVVELERQVAELGQRTDASGSAKRVEELTAELRGVRHRQVFDRIAAAKNARPEAIEDLWALSGYRPEADVVDEGRLGQLIDEQAQKRAYLFKQAEAPPEGGEPPRPGPAAGRGAPTGTPAGKFAVRNSDVGKPEWWTANGKAYLEAQAAGNVHWLPE